MSQERVWREVNERIKESLKQGELTCLELDSIPIRIITKQIKALLEEYPFIEYLTMNDCELTSLSNFPKLDNLSILELSNNQIQDAQLYHLLKCSHISHLMIDQNRLKNIQKISILRQLPLLQQLQIAGNRIGDTEFYRQQLFDRIPHLKIIDCHDKFGNIAINSQSEPEQSQEQQNHYQMNTNKSPSLKQESKSLLNLLGLESQQQSLPYEENNQEIVIHVKEQRQNEKNNVLTSSSLTNSVRLVHEMNNIDLNLTGSKRVKKEQSPSNQTDNNNELIKQSSKIFNKKTALIEEQSSSPELSFLTFKRQLSEECQQQ